MKASSNFSRQKRELTKLWLRYRVPFTGAIVLALVLGGGTTIWENFRDANQASHETDAKQVIEAVSGALGNPARDLIAAVEAAAQDASVAEALKTGDLDTATAKSAELRQALPGSLGARLLAVNVRKTLYDDQMPPVSFGTLDLVRRARTESRPAPVEVHLVGRDEEHVAVVRPVRADEQLLGFLQAAYPIDAIAERTSSLPVGSSYVELIQSVAGGKPVILGRAGDASLKSGVGRIVPVRGTGWRLVFWFPVPTAAQLDVLSDLLPVIAGVVVLLLLAAVVVLLAVRKRRREARRVMLGGAVTTVEIQSAGPEGALAGVPFTEAPAEPVAPQAAAPKVAAPPPPPSVDLDLSEPVDLDFSSLPPPLPEVDEGPELEFQSAAEPAAGGGRLDPVIFRAYDIRGIVGNGLDVEVVRLLGQAIGTEAYERGQQTIVVARDGRTSSDELRDALVDGLLSTGRDVIDIGRVPTPVLYFATYFLDTGSGVMVTGSHNPANYNGLKIMLGGETLFGDAIQDLRVRVENGQLHEGRGELQQMDLLADYIRRVSEDIPVALGRSFKLVVDCGNGVAGEVAPKLLQALGHDVVELYCDIDGSFPNHAPDPTQPANLQDLIATVREQNADLGLAFDGDGDRVGVVDNIGNIIWADRLMMMYAADILSRHPGAAVVFDVKSTSHLRTVVEQNGGEPIMDKTGHSFMKNKLLETPGAQLAGELSGHIFFKERWYGFDDGMYSAARLLELLMASGRPPAEVFAELPSGVNTPELYLHLNEGQSSGIMQKALAAAALPDAQLYTIDGLRAEFADGWGLMRASNTTPAIIFRFEGDDETALERIKGLFRAILAEVDSSLELPF
ncbi:MAG: phosphomannomutase/phosphoglucomutase [Pseudomonadota bacterium]